MVRILFFLILIIVGTVLVVRSQLTPFNNQAAAPPTNIIFTPITIPIEEVLSPDGTMTVILDNGSLYTQDDDGNKKYIYTVKNLPGEFYLSPNSWSPDNKYFFILRKNDNNITGLVFNVASGEAPNYEPITVEGKPITTITGWDSPQFLHVRTASENGGKGPSFWFDVMSKTYIQLGN